MNLAKRPRSQLQYDPSQKGQEVNYTMILAKRPRSQLHYDLSQKDKKSITLWC